MLANMIQGRFLTAVGCVDPIPIDIQNVLRRTVISCHGAVVERLPLLFVRRPYEGGVVFYKEFEYFGCSFFFGVRKLFGEADCSVHNAEARFVDYEDVRIEGKEELD